MHVCVCVWMSVCLSVHSGVRMSQKLGRSHIACWVFKLSLWTITCVLTTERQSAITSTSNRSVQDRLLAIKWCCRQCVSLSTHTLLNSSSLSSFMWNTRTATTLDCGGQTMTSVIISIICWPVVISNDLCWYSCLTTVLGFRWTLYFVV